MHKLLLLSVSVLLAPEIVVQPMDTVFEPKCEVTGKALDLIFVLDSSGSLKEKFGEVTAVIKRILDIVAVGPQATRVALINYSGVQRTEFHFNTFSRKKNILQAVETIRSLKGITKTGAALEYTMGELDERYGMRGEEIPKIVFLLSDGRSHDGYKDVEMAEALRSMFPRGVLKFWAFGTGEYVAINSLVALTKDLSKIVTNKNLQNLNVMFKDFEGVEICEEVPVCVPGSDKPLDLIIIVDSSSSLGDRFQEQINFLRRIISPMNIHPDAVRLALITFSTNAKLRFDWGRFRTTDAAVDFLNSLVPQRGTTNTRMALDQANSMFQNPERYGGRVGVPQMIVIMTDGHSRTAPRSAVNSLVRVLGVSIYAVSVNAEVEIDFRELVQLTGGSREQVFTQNNLHYFEENFVHHIGFGCPGLDGLGSEDFVQGVRGSVKVRCQKNVVELKIRTMRPFAGWLYVKDYFNDINCLTRGDDSREVKLTILDGQCGIKAVPFSNGTTSGYRFNYTAMIQFHPEIVTRVDQGLDVECLHEEFVPENRLSDALNQRAMPLLDTQCQYNLRKWGADCIALDARVGELLFHNWECDNDGYGMLIHDCFVESDEKTLEIIDHQGCSVDPYILETPSYSRAGAFGYFTKAKRDMSVWKFPVAGSLRFRCKISLCDMEGAKTCKYQLNPTCPDTDYQGTKRTKRQAPHYGTKDGFEMTLDVETRRLNVLESEKLKPDEVLNYCSAGY